MKLIASLPMVAFAALSLSACADAPIAATVDNQHVAFNHIEYGTSVTDQSISVTVTGSADPIPSAVDDEFSLSLRLDFDRALLTAAAPHSTLAVHGTTVFASQEVQPGSSQSSTFSPGSGHSGAVLSAAVWGSCFCTRTGNESQDIDGSIELDTISATTARFHYSLTVDGAIPYRTFQSTAHAVFTGTVDVALQ